MAAAGLASAAEKYVVGVSNTLVGNGWREEMVCSIKAEALASGMVSKVILANRNGGPSEQIADLRNLISAGVRLVPLGQSDGQRVLAALEPVVEATARRALITPLDDVGSAAMRADLASLLHETQYTRLFRS